MVGIGRTWSEASSFPSDKTGKNCDFAQVLKRSICLEQNTQAWCDNCEKYQPTVSGACPGPESCHMGDSAVVSSGTD